MFGKGFFTPLLDMGERGRMRREFKEKKDVILKSFKEVISSR